LGSSFELRAEWVAVAPALGIRLGPDGDLGNGELT
jgi:hypothetical protein